MIAEMVPKEYTNLVYSYAKASVNQNLAFYHEVADKAVGAITRNRVDHLIAACSVLFIADLDSRACPRSQIIRTKCSSTHTHTHTLTHKVVMLGCTAW